MDVLERVLLRPPPLAQQLRRLGGDVKVLLSACLLLLEDEPRELALRVHLAPSEFQDVAAAKPREAAEQERPTDAVIVTGRGGEPPHLVDSEVHPLPLLGLETLNAPQGVRRYHPLVVRLRDAGFQFIEIGHSAVAREPVFAPVPVVARPRARLPFEVVLETANVVGRDVLECPLPQAGVINAEVLEAGAPVPPVPSAVLPEPFLTQADIIVVEIRPLLELVTEAELAVLQFDDALRTDSLREGERLPVRHLVGSALFGDEVQVQVLITAATVNVDVKIQGSPPRALL